LRYDIQKSCKDNYVFLLQKLKTSFQITIMISYFLCGSMYIAVIWGPHKENMIEQPLMLFLVWLSLCRY
jgi:hypothetical protein